MQKNFRFQPIIFVHGVTSRAVVFVGHRNYFISRGYKSAELYATSYGDGGVTPFMQGAIDCDLIKQVKL